MTGFDKLTAKINDNAKKTADDIICKAGEEIAKIQAEYVQKKEEANVQIYESAMERAEAIKVSARAKADAEYNAIIKQHKDTMIANVVDSATNEIVSLKDDKYVNFMAGLLLKALEHQLDKEREYLQAHRQDIASLSYELILRKRDRDAYAEKIIDVLRNISEGKIPTNVIDKIVISSNTISVKGGFILVAGEDSIDASFDKIIEDIKIYAGKDISKMLFEIN